MVSAIGKKRKFWKRRQSLFIIGMSSMAVLNFLVFWVYVNFSSILMAFQSPSGSGFSLENFERLFQAFIVNNAYDNPAMFSTDAVKNTLIFFAVGLVVITPLSLIFSYFIYKKIVGYRVFRVIFFLPSIISVVVLTSLYGYMMGPKGFIAKFVQMLLGMDDVPILLGESRFALITLIFYNIWAGFGVNIILFNGAMSRIPVDIIEYDRLEGVGFARELFQIIIPLIWPTLTTVIVFAFVGMFNASGPIMFFTKGHFNTNTISYFIFAQVYEYGGIQEYAAAVGLFFTLIGLPLVLFVKWGLQKIGGEIEY